MKYFIWGLLWPLLLLSSDPSVSSVGAGIKERRMSTSPRPIYVQATTKVKSNGVVLLNMECQSELFEPDKTMEIELRIYRPGRPIKTINLTVDV